MTNLEQAASLSEAQKVADDTEILLAELQMTWRTIERSDPDEADNQAHERVSQFAPANSASLYRKSASTGGDPEFIATELVLGTAKVRAVLTIDDHDDRWALLTVRNVAAPVVRLVFCPMIIGAVNDLADQF